MISLALTAPSAWASYLIDGDCSGLDAAEALACEDWLRAERLGRPVTCVDAGFLWSHDASRFAPASDCQEYVFLVVAPLPASWAA